MNEWQTFMDRTGTRTAIQCFEDEIESAIEDAACHGINYADMRQTFEAAISAAEKDARWEEMERK